MKKIILLLLLITFSCEQEPFEPYYKIDQKVYSVQGVDSVKTNAWWHEYSHFVGYNVYKKGNTLDNKLADSLEAVKFTRTHKNNQ